MGIGKKTGVASLIVLIAVAVNHYRQQQQTIITLSPVLEISTGKLQGIVSYTRDGKKIHEYRKIPFAKPPVAELRFAPPSPPEKWTGILDASESPPYCIQISVMSGNVEGSEDCLYVNVFTPAKWDNLLPVMVYFHGGAFIFGSSSRYNPAYLLDEDIILVTVQYRLASLGFMNTGDNVVRGNMGLKDQIMALKWVKENIGHFGGSDKVTITGESAGGASVGYHLISPLSKGLFNRAIMQSGSPLANWAISRQPAQQAKRFAAKFNCSSSDGNDDDEARGSQEMIDCLRKVDAYTYVSAHKEVLVAFRDKVTLFIPSIETVVDSGTFLGEEPLEALLSGRVNQVPLIIGANEDEGLLTSAIVTANHTKLRQANDDWNFFSSRLLWTDINKPEIATEIRKFYFGNVEDIGSIEYIKNYTNLLSDRMFFQPIHQYAKLFSKHSSPVRMYLYTYPAQFSLADFLAASQSETVPVVVRIIWEMVNRWVHVKMGRPLSHLGVCHGDELQLLFNWGLSSFIGQSHADYKMSKTMVKLWADFIKEKDSLSIDGVKWQEISSNDPSLRYLFINVQSKMENEPFTERLKFWESLNI